MLKVVVKQKCSVHEMDLCINHDFKPISYLIETQTLI